MSVTLVICVKTTELIVLVLERSLGSAAWKVYCKVSSENIGTFAVSLLKNMQDLIAIFRMNQNAREPNFDLFTRCVATVHPMHFHLKAGIFEYNNKKLC